MVADIVAKATQQCIPISVLLVKVLEQRDTMKTLSLKKEEPLAHVAKKPMGTKILSRKRKETNVAII